MKKWILLVLLFLFILFGFSCQLHIDTRIMPTEPELIVEEKTNDFVIENRPDWVIPQTLEYEVTVTIYYPVKEQTDDSPHITADNTRFDPKKAGKYRYCALSRDLLSRWDGPFDYGDEILLENAGKYSGKWIVKDTMHHRWEKRVDLLVDIGTKLTKFENAVMRGMM